MTPREMVVALRERYGWPAAAVLIDSLVNEIVADRVPRQWTVCEGTFEVDSEKREPSVQFTFGGGEFDESEYALNDYYGRPNTTSPSTDDERKRRLEKEIRWYEDYLESKPSNEINELLKWAVGAAEHKAYDDEIEGEVGKR